MVVEIPPIDILTISSAGLLIATFGVVVRRGFADWLSAYRYQTVVLAAVTAVIAYFTGVWEIYVAAALTLVIKAIIIPKVLLRVTKKIKDEFKIETNPYVSLRLSVLISALLVALSYALTQQMFPASSLDRVTMMYLPVSISLFFIGLFVMVSRRMALNQVVGLLIIENGLFLFTTALTHGVSLIIEIGIFVDILIGIIISAILIFRISRTFDTLDIGSLEKLRDD
ncbi:hydrogenase 4 membrane component (E) [Candidatus Nitrososphaera evergladensis SR1]|uniref:Hydrogenase 4 membrane component (E) n=1 Tax=Candidatus Nitrososphaera evergladensis SR1 TaxID=1459636 RepID=A0A075MV16_9ARCH|nr:hydrogenase 4 membrane component (E) [Candidatus Nitrososphaera evergladensis SR1]